MADYAMLKQTPIATTDAGQLDALLKSVDDRVQGISVTHYTTPQVVVLHCGEYKLDESALAALRAAADQPLPAG